jgi:DNA ligase-associated metallophosphoesterase
MIKNFPLEIANEILHLLPERALYWPRSGTLFIADPHFGKAATFRAHAIPLPEGTTEAELQRLTQALDRTGAQRLIILGDLLHAAKGREPAVLDAVSQWRAERGDLEIYLVRGNHDRHAGDPPADWRMTLIDGPTPGPHWVLNHEPLEPTTGYALVGHLHPAVQLTGKGRQTLKLPCFWFGEKCGVLPAFSAFVDHGTIRPRQGEQVFVVTEQQVLAV